VRVEHLKSALTLAPSPRAGKRKSLTLALVSRERLSMKLVKPFFGNFFRPPDASSDE
jgi:hypothetical protein